MNQFILADNPKDFRHHFPGLIPSRAIKVGLVVTPSMDSLSDQNLISSRLGRI